MSLGLAVAAYDIGSALMEKIFLSPLLQGFALVAMDGLSADRKEYAYE